MCFAAVTVVTRVPLASCEQPDTLAAKGARMLQSFDESASPEHGPSRLSALRSALIENDLDGFLVPRSDVYQGE